MLRLVLQRHGVQRSVQRAQLGQKWRGGVHAAPLL